MTSSSHSFWIAASVTMAVILIFAGIGIAGMQYRMQLQQQRVQEAQENAVQSNVEEFGSQIKLVSLLAPHDTVVAQIPQVYGCCVAPQLLEKWQNNIGEAPGRTVSSPWPDSIFVTSIIPAGSGRYDVRGQIILRTSTGPSGLQSVRMTVAKIGSNWLITQYRQQSFSSS